LTPFNAIPLSDIEVGDGDQFDPDALHGEEEDPEQDAVQAAQNGAQMPIFAQNGADIPAEAAVIPAVIPANLRLHGLIWTPITRAVVADRTVVAELSLRTVRTVIADSAFASVLTVSHVGLHFMGASKTACKRFPKSFQGEWFKNGERDKPPGERDSHPLLTAQVQPHDGVGDT
jgi:hypothetical protein